MSLNSSVNKNENETKNIKKGNMNDINKFINNVSP